MRARRFLVTATLAAAAAAGTALAASPASAFDYSRYTNNYGYDGNYGKGWHDYNPGQSYYKIADIKVTVDGVTKAANGQEFLYTITVTNQGKATASNVKATADLQGGYTYLADRASQGTTTTQNIEQGEMLTHNDGRVLADFGTLKAGQSATLQIAGQAPGYGTGSLTQQIQASTSSAETSYANNGASIVTQVG
jgi:uncharacterized repeat protein (TIGR01451 family)